ncbi:LPXTG cell wall anchor domain-containing protein [Actinobacteria bacterium YIM 96077]|uniref:Gram-positive cocci surface proteins LPxTG domain-containing protein n=1 Tax=Phytoactinopolyspora halophila TaxID=1981511 RepID=A0A329QI77_9ACTN|nr:LPXTG cell wall anchor domain-containing protein [Phytoactinopolyspora halophila]AYY14658.1 LPXTG cell wall anchor domain-containing protein [Actinobacteria bacterium YIM 96077]RAW11631.1 hypothetical protein DPM12_16310 [Phytoactinopolyspora halophila]
MRLVRRMHRIVVPAVLGTVGTALAVAPAAAVGAGGPLPDTGSSVLWWVVGAVVVLAAGGGLYALSRRGK